MIKNIFSRASNKSQKGQGMTEYLIMVGVIAIGALGVFGYMGEALEEQVVGVSAEISGQDGTDNRDNAVDAVANANTLTADDQNNLSNYTGQNQ